MRDYFPYWHKAGRTGDTGKLLLVDFLNETRLDVFFDDNIQETGEDTGIIAVQDTAGNGITPVYAHRYYLVRALLGLYSMTGTGISGNLPRS